MNIAINGKLTEATCEPGLRIVFDGPPSHQSGRFVEVEDETGNSVNAGSWNKRDDGLWELRLYDAPGAATELLEIAKRLALATNEGDDLAQGTHYLDKQGRIRCKGSFLALIEEARRAVIAKAAEAQRIAEGRAL